MGQAVRFDAVGDKYSRSSSGLNTSTSITWCCWVKLASNTGTYQPFLCVDDGTTGSVQMGTVSDGETPYMQDGVVGSQGPLTVGTWYFVAAVTDISGGEDWLYYVAAPATTLPQVDYMWTLSSQWGDTKTFLIANNLAGFGQYLDGSIAQVKIWTRALTKTQLEAEMYSDSVVDTANLWAYYSFRAGPQTNDESGNGRTLTAAGTLVADTSGPPITAASPAPMFLSPTRSTVTLA